jgi:hypothetical protein
MGRFSINPYHYGGMMTRSFLGADAGHQNSRGPAELISIIWV